MILSQNQNVAFINTINTNTTTLPGSSYNTGSYYGIYLNAGTMSLVDNSGVSAFGNLGAITFDYIQGSPTYVTATAETAGVLTYTANNALNSTTYYLTLTQFIPISALTPDQPSVASLGYGQHQTFTQVIQWTSPATGTVTATTIAVGLKNAINNYPGFHVLATNSSGVLTITASTGYPLLGIGAFDQYATSYVVTTPGVQSIGYPTDMTNNGYASLPGYTSANNYDMIVFTYTRIQNNAGVPYQSTVFINHGDANNASLKACLTAGNATSVLNFHALASTDAISAAQLDRQ